MITLGGNKYEVVLANKWYLRELVDRITLEDNLQEIAYRANVDMTVTDDFPGISPGQEIRVSGIPFGGSSMVYLLHPGVVWDIDSAKQNIKRLTATIYDRTIYLPESEDEYLFPAGQTADQRLRIYAEQWGIPLSANIPNTGIPLAKSLKRPASIYSHITADLKETAKKGGKLYRPRMTPNGLELYELGTNSTVWILEEEAGVEEIGQNRTLSGAVTRVKVLGQADDQQKSPVLAVVDGDRDKYGTIQKILQDPDIKNASEATAAAQQMLTGMQETFRVTGIDINTIRAGDKVQLNGMDLIVRSITHDLGEPGHMSAELETIDQIRRRIYLT